MNAAACIAALKQVKRAIEELGRLPRKLAVTAAPLISAELRDQFRAGTDPYGTPWAPLKPSTLKQHGPPPLTRTRALADGTRAIPMAGGKLGIVAIVGKSYGAFHQVGFRVGKTRVPPRRILPNRGMPARWRAILDRTARALAAQARSR